MKANTKFIQIRSAGTVGKRKKLYIKGYAGTKGKYDTYGFMKLPNGKTRTFKSLFTDECLEDMKKQALSKTVFIDANHKIATDMGVIKLLKDNGADEEDIKLAEDMLKTNKLPFAKLVEFDVDDRGFSLGVETNPYFAELDDAHAKYYDANINSIQDGYVKGFSFNFDPVDYVTENDDDGNQLSKYSKCNLYGISMTSNQALADNEITEVAMRSMMEIRNQIGDKMTEPIKKTDIPDTGTNTPVPTPKPAEAQVPPTSGLTQADVDKAVEAKLQEVEMQRQQETQTQTVQRLEKEMEELRKNQLPPSNKQGQSVVKPDDKYGNIQGNPEQNLLTDRDKLKEKYDEITSKHRLHMEDIRSGKPASLARGNYFDGFGELVMLQAEMNSHKVKKSNESDQDYQTRMALQSQSKKDDMVLYRYKE